MVARFVLLLFLAVQGWSATALLEKVRDFVGTETYEKNRSFIAIIFKDESGYYHNGHLDVVKVVETLKNNGLIQLFFTEPSHMTLTFKTNATPLFFVKLMGDTLRAVGYYRYITEYSKNDTEGFVWTIGLTSEYATDPILLRRELLKRGCDIVDMQRDDVFHWSYTVDMQNAHMDLRRISSGEVLELKSALSEHWLDVSDVKLLKMTSLRSNQWYPDLAFFDAQLHLLKSYKRDKKTWQIKLAMPRDAVYVRIGDLYHLKNIKEGLEIEAIGVK